MKKIIALTIALAAPVALAETAETKEGLYEPPIKVHDECAPPNKLGISKCHMIFSDDSQYIYYERYGCQYTGYAYQVPASACKQSQSEGVNK